MIEALVQSIRDLTDLRERQRALYAALLVAVDDGAKLEHDEVLGLQVALLRLRQQMRTGAALHASATDRYVPLLAIRTALAEAFAAMDDAEAQWRGIMQRVERERERESNNT